MNTSQGVLDGKKDNALIVFIKYPEPGQVKTRLAKDIGNEKACSLYMRLVCDVIKNIFNNNKTYDICIFFSPPEREKELKQWLTVDAIFQTQKGFNLGERMCHAFQYVLHEKGFKKGVIIGTDCPEIHFSLIEEAFSALEKKDIVIGPCRDGGYYLLGMSKVATELFEDIPWSSHLVFKQTMKKAVKNDLSVHILKKLVDIDTLDDLLSSSAYRKTML
ncbi:MAG: TIGR04282 family arsenosugar biosynthesis glycosyltransferase [Candidatus Brocadiaceae bacterium]|nr:TIGR04282 family arsenosugar biosynthesis glycosyltransferase [Candidatus Brocadiaceae bacterium]